MQESEIFAIWNAIYRHWWVGGWKIDGYQRAATNNIALHYSDVIIRAMVSQITGVSMAFSTVCSGAAQRKHQSSASLAFVRGVHRSPVNSPQKGPVTRKIFPFDDVIMNAVGDMACHPGGYYWDYYPSTLSDSPCPASHLITEHP